MQNLRYLKFYSLAILHLLLLAGFTETSPLLSHQQDNIIYTFRRGTFVQIEKERPEVLTRILYFVLLIFSERMFPRAPFSKSLDFLSSSNVPYGIIYCTWQCCLRDELWTVGEQYCTRNTAMGSTQSLVGHPYWVCWKDLSYIFYSILSQAILFGPNVFICLNHSSFSPSVF